MSRFLQISVQILDTMAYDPIIRQRCCVLMARPLYKLSPFIFVGKGGLLLVNSGHPMETFIWVTGLEEHMVAVECQVLVVRYVWEI